MDLNGLDWVNKNGSMSNSGADNERCWRSGKNSPNFGLNYLLNNLFGITPQNSTEYWCANNNIIIIMFIKQS